MSGTRAAVETHTEPLDVAPRSGLALLVNASANRTAIEEAGFEVVICESAMDALAIAERLLPDVALVGTGSTESSAESALGLVRRLRAAAAALPVIVLATRSAAGAIEPAYQAGATDVWSEDAPDVVWKRRLPFVVSAARALDELARSGRKLEQARRVARFATWEWNLETQQVSWSDELRSLLDRAESEPNAGVACVLEMVDEADRPRIAGEIADAIRARRPFRFDHRATRGDGTAAVLHHEGDVVQSGSQVRIEAVVADVTGIRRAEHQLHGLANYDPLTGLPNRLSFVELLEHARARSERSGAPIAVALLDIDRFKDVNESLGQGAGDRLLREVAGRLLGAVRKEDCVAREGDGFLRTVARRGGDEFLVMLTDVHQVHHAALAARRILEALRRPFRIDGREIFATASIGISFGRDPGVGTEERIRQAEIAMYSAKSQGRNTAQFFDESMNAAVLERFETEGLLRRALARNELVLYYQPLVRARTREVVGIEALVRWKHPVRGLLSADEFVPLAEETGLIVGIGRWVLSTACDQLRAWSERGLRTLRLSVNLSPRELRAPGFVASLAKILERTGIEPSRLELELTERGVVGNDPRTLEVLLRLKEMGVRLAVDDFGTGNTTFQYLKNFPLTTIKIDKSFTSGIASGDAKDAAIIKALLAMARRLELNVVAEGVENEAQLSFLGENDCEEVQGYLFGRPVPPEGIPESLR